MKAIIFALALTASAVTLRTADETDALVEANKVLKKSIEEQLDGWEQEISQKVYGLTDAGKDCLKLLEAGEKQKNALAKACDGGHKKDADGNTIYPLECEKEIMTATPYTACWEALISYELFAGEEKSDDEEAEAPKGPQGICSSELHISSKAVQTWCNEMQNENPNYGAWTEGESYAAFNKGKATETYNKDYQDATEE